MLKKGSILKKGKAGRSEMPTVRSQGRVCCVNYREIEADRVNGDLHLAGEVLQRSRQEGLRKEEARDPEDLKHTKTSSQVLLCSIQKCGCHT